MASENVRLKTEQQKNTYFISVNQFFWNAFLPFTE